MWLMIILQTIGSFDMPGSGARKMPAPRAYAAIAALWVILGMMAETGAGKMAARLSMLLVLAGAVIGPFGQRAVGLLSTISTRFGTPATTVGSAASLTQTGQQLQAAGARNRNRSAGGVQQAVGSVATGIGQNTVPGFVRPR